MSFLDLVSKGDLTAVENFLETSTDLTQINAQEETDRTALHIAAYNGHLEVAQALLTSPKFTKVSINARTRSGWTALHSAALKGHSAIVQLLLESLDFTDQSISSVTTMGRTALHFAAINKHTAAAEILLNSGRFPETLINLQDRGGETALHWWANNQQVQSLRYVLATEETTHLHVLKFNLDLHNTRNLKPEEMTTDSEIRQIFARYRQVWTDFVLDRNWLTQDGTKSAR